MTTISPDEDTAMTAEHDDRTRVALARLHAGIDSLIRREGESNSNVALLRRTAETIESDDPTTERTRELLLGCFDFGLRLWENYGRFEHILEDCIIPCQHSGG